MRDFEDATEASWSRFTRRLTTFLQDEILDASPVRLLWSGEYRLDALMTFGWEEPVVDVVMDADAAGSDTESVRESMRALGWDEDDDVYYFAVELDGVENLVSLAVGALRTVIGVAHPALLDVDGGPAAIAALRVPTPTIAAMGATVRAEAADEPIAVVPHDRDHLLQLVDDALTPVFGHAPIKDHDGDIPVRSEGARVFVSVPATDPAVDLVGLVVADVQDRLAALRAVAILNRNSRYVCFFLQGDSVLARLHLPASPFVPSHVRRMLALMLEVLAEVPEDLAERTGGRRAVDVTDLDDEADGGPGTAQESFADEPGSDQENEELPHELMMLLQLDPEGTGAVEPEVAAAVCHHDSELILSLIRQCEQEEIAWSTAAEAAEQSGDADEIGACRREAAGWDSTIALLRTALRHVAESLPRRPSR
ncbi:putative sensory transduction regulator [Mumia flava]|uniref:Putative sensory transduction regulator n=1 Tax=Mumia flava TaxID=1348852 RepID=A0A0B2BT67_9ACTN|nr:YbjN domain-containing protein [Mumia flava]PJJ53756.1 putative sensory transduction regulator [Mumia flava]